MRRLDRRPIGVFDSGVGGLSVLRALRAELPGEDFVYFADTANAPYGERDEAFVAQRSLAIARELVEQHGATLLVIACNTATAAAIHLLRDSHPGLPIVGIEPALKPAALSTRTGRVGVMATRGTLASAKFNALLGGLRHQAEFILQACDGLAHAIETGDNDRAASLCERYAVAIRSRAEVDTLVLGCTHYVFVQDTLRRLMGPGVTMVEAGAPVARRAAALLAGRAPGPGSVRYLSSTDTVALEDFASRWIPG
jgi:glutamate racemase